MFKIVSICIAIMLTVLNAGMIESEIGINVGLSSTKNEDGNKFKNPTMGLTYQDNKYVVSPRVDLEYTKVKNDHADALLKISVNGVYEYENRTSTIPYALAGVGYESVSGATKEVFESHPFVQAGVGVRVDLEQGFKTRIEGRVLEILGGNNEGNEFILTVGLSMPLSKPVKTRFRQVSAPRPVPIITVAAPTPTPARREVIVTTNNECSIKINAPDLDRDGIPNNIDQCPATPCHFTVDNYGCPVKTTFQINFATNSALINSSSFYKLNNFASFLMQNKGSQVKIVGHTDSLGSAMHNLNLSDKRARAVVQALIGRGVSPARLQSEGKGESIPIASNQTNSGKAMNRRIEARLFYPRGRR